MKHMSIVSRIFENTHSFLEKGIQIFFPTVVIVESKKKIFF